MTLTLSGYHLPLLVGSATAAKPEYVRPPYRVARWWGGFVIGAIRCDGPAYIIRMYGYDGVPCSIRHYVTDK